MSKVARFNGTDRDHWNPDDHTSQMKFVPGVAEERRIDRPLAAGDVRPDTDAMAATTLKAVACRLAALGVEEQRPMAYGAAGMQAPERRGRLKAMCKHLPVDRAASDGLTTRALAQRGPLLDPASLEEAKGPACLATTIQCPEAASASAGAGTGGGSAPDRTRAAGRLTSCPDVVPRASIEEAGWRSDAPPCAEPGAEVLVTEAHEDRIRVTALREFRREMSSMVDAAHRGTGAGIGTRSTRSMIRLHQRSAEWQQY